ncbi:uncharacterized protein [Dysidea avara]|uniref:uncharacterized protein n=1 Tax=Dysidea avara TaxID=196820 RepID=UPI00332FEA4B
MATGVKLLTTVCSVVLMMELCLGAEASLSVTITADVDNLVCDNQTVTLSCNAANATQLHWIINHKEVSTNRTISVIATPVPSQYFCNANDDHGNTGESHITIVSNGSTPCLDRNFHSTVPVSDGQSINITVKFLHNTPSCNLPVISGQWSRINGYMPHLSGITNGTDFSRLAFYNISASYAATYVFTAVNQCGTKFIEVLLDVDKKQTCISNEDAIPIKTITPNQTIIKGESISLSCLFEDRYDPNYLDFTVYWMVGNTNILRESNHTGYQLDEPKQVCSSGNDSCCLFVSILHINTAALSDSVAVTCNAIHNGHKSSKTANLTVIERPVLTNGPHSANVKENSNKSLTCNFDASDIQYLSICAFQYNLREIRISPSSKYSIQKDSGTNSGRKNQIHCKLTIFDFDSTDEGLYTCYCFYNQSLEQKYHFHNDLISSNNGTAMLHFITNDSHEDSSSHMVLIIACIAVAVLVIIILIAGLITVIRIKRHNRKRGYEELPEISSPGNKRTIFQGGADEPDSSAPRNGDVCAALQNSTRFDNPLRCHASDFCRLVDRTSLAPMLYSKGLLTIRDIETLSLPTMIDSDKLSHLLTKLTKLNKDDFNTFMDCLKLAEEHRGHVELYKILAKEL